MSKFANVVTIEVAPGRRDQVVALLLAHKARLKGEPGTLQFEVLLPKDGDTKVRVYEMYRDAAAFEEHLKGPRRDPGGRGVRGHRCRDLPRRCARAAQRSESARHGPPAHAPRGRRGADRMGGRRRPGEHPAARRARRALGGPEAAELPAVGLWLRPEHTGSHAARYPPAVG